MIRSDKMAAIGKCFISNGCSYVCGDWVKIERMVEGEKKTTSGQIVLIGNKKITVVTTPWFKNGQFGHNQEAEFFICEDIISINGIQKLFDY